MKDALHNTMNSINHWQGFRLKLFAEGCIIGLSSGLVISFFRFALFWTEKLRSEAYLFLRSAPAAYLLPLFLFLAVIAFLLTRLVKTEPLASGSGIPQVKGALMGLVKLRWTSILWTKLLGGILAIGAGLSLGREGPSIQLGAVTAQGISRGLGRTRMEERYLLTSGASAGLAAAFNAPLAGVIFALEELHKNFSIVVLLPSMTAAVCATVVSRALFGRDAIFIFEELPLVPIDHHYGIIILAALIAGLAGVAFNKGLLSISRFYALPFFKNTFAKLLFPLFSAGVLGLYLPQVLGGGNELINGLVRSPAPLRLLALFLLGKFLFTLFSYGSGAPGGFFLPMLVIGALCGGLCGQACIALGLLEPSFAPNIIVISMAALFAACTKAPITGMVLIMEMTASYQHLLVLALASLVAFSAAELCGGRPIYEELLLRSLEQGKPKKDLLRQRNVTELAVASGSVLENKLIKHVAWPPDTLLVDIKRGEQQLIPHGDTLLRAGDYLYIMTENANIPYLASLAEEKAAD